MSTIQSTTIEQETMQVIEDFLSAASHLDHERFMTFFDPSEATTWIDDGGFFVRSREKLNEAVKQVFDQWEQADIHLDQAHVDPLAENAAVITGVSRISGKVKTGEEIQLRQNCGYVLVR